MAGLRLSGVEKRFGPQPVLEAIDLEIADGELVVVVGPSGCGKSTLLRIIAGLEDPDAGTLEIAGRDMAEVPPSERGVAMVFQSYALYPHMSVFENMAFALKTAKRPKDEIDAAVRSAARTLDLEALLERKPKALSGGQRQRVAIGRAIVRQPEVFLFDEPLSNLDAALRVRMRHELARLHDELKTTMVYVTHDQVEAVTLADRIVVLNQGRIEQVGTPQALYRRPANLFVAGFIGSPRMNLLPVQLMEAGEASASVWLGARAIPVRNGAGGAKPGETLTLGVRPEGLRPTRTDDGLALTVRFVEPLGGVAYAHGMLEGAPEPVIVQLPGDTAAAAGDVIRLKIDAAAGRLFDSSGRAVE